MKPWLKREVYVAVHGQTKKFRIVKYFIFLSLAAILYYWKGLALVGYVFLFLTFVAFGMHFLFRWKTKAWTQSWGLYKKIDIPNS